MVYLQAEVSCRPIRILKHLPLVTATREVVHIEAIEKSVEHLNKPHSLCHFIPSCEFHSFCNRFTEDLHMYMYMGV